MGRWEFMRKLEELLSDISPSEREEALQYYNDYFNDAGRENEKEVIQALGSPEEVAEIVRSGLMDDPDKGNLPKTDLPASRRQHDRMRSFSQRRWKAAVKQGRKRNREPAGGVRIERLKIQAALQKEKQKAEKKRMGFRPGRSC